MPCGVVGGGQHVKIEDLYIEGFGPFTSKPVGPFTGPIIVIHGANEAGKSSLLAFIRMVLFGFPSTKSSTHYPPLAGGQHGGRLSLVDDSGRRYAVERFRGVRGGPVSIMTRDGAPVDEAILSKLLGGASSDVFKNVFAFSLDELQAEKSLQGADVDSQIYSAGMGAARLPQALKAIRDQKIEIFRRQGRKHIIADLISELEEVGSSLGEAQGNAAEYGRLVKRQGDIELELETGNAERSRLGRHLAGNEKLLEGWEDWVSFVDVEGKLATLPKFNGFPEEAISRLTSAEERLSAARRDFEEASEQLEQAEKSAQAEIGNEGLLQHREQIEHIRRGRNRFDDSVRDLPERRTELQSLENSLGERLRDIGQDWVEERLESFDTSIVTRNHIEHVRQALAGNVAEVQQRTGQLDQAKGRLRELEEAEKQALKNAGEKEEPALDAAGLEKKRSALRTTRTRFDGFARLRLRHSDLRDQLVSSTGQTAVESHSRWIQGRGLPLLLGVAAIILIAVSAALGQQSLFIGGIAGALLLIIAIYIYLNADRVARDGASPGNQALVNSVGRADTEESEAEQRLREASAVLGLDLPDDVELDDVESQLGASDMALRAWESIQQQLADAIEARQHQERRVENTTHAQVTAQKGLEAAGMEWQTWLIDRGLTERLTPETMVDFRGQVETARVGLGEVRTMRRRIEAIEHDIDEYRELIVPLADTFGMPIGTDGRRELASAADGLIARYDVVRESVSQRDIARNEAEIIGQQLQQRGKRLEEHQEVLAQLLGAGGADDPEEFRRRAAQHAERSDLERKRGEHLVRLQKLSGPGAQFDLFKEGLAQTSPQPLEDNSRELARQIEGNEEGRNALLGEQGEVRTLLSQLTSEEESSALRVRRNVLIEELREQAREWSKLTIAEELLLRTRRKFEEERQPGVIQHAQKFFSTITDQRYDRLHSPIGEQKLTVIERAGVSKQPTELSRGTREQLYLSLRFGLIREFGERTERLPVVVDEVLVNFDPDRARRAAEAFAELAQTNQVLVFTCHPETVALFTDVAPETQVIQIDLTE
jgi:uncharacterized protein YhaN